MTRMSANQPLETDDVLTLGGAGRRDGALATLRRGLRLVPELRRGLGVTLLTIGCNGPDYDLTAAEALCRWRDRR